MNAYVIESVAFDAEGKRRGVFRHCVATKERAIEECAKAPGRTWRELSDDEKERDGKIVRANEVANG